MKATVLFFVALVGALLSLGASCTGEASGAAGHGAVSGPTPGAHGTLLFTLSPDEPTHEGPNRFHLDLDGAASKTPFEGATISVNVVMPAMGHETTSMEATDLGGGSYELPGVVFDMPGAWSLRLRVEKSGLVDEVELPLEIP